MVADKIDGPRTKENERRRDRDNRSADHDGAPFIIVRGFPGAAGALRPRARMRLGGARGIDVTRVTKVRIFLRP
jgi:hypothetical protein